MGIIPHSQAELLRISLLVPAGAGLLFAEYRLSVHNLAASISAVVFAGVARGLSKATVRYYPGTVCDHITQIWQFIIIQALIGLIWIWIFWSPFEPVFTLDFQSIPLQLTNALASALTVTLGKSLLLPTDDVVLPVDAGPARHRWDVLNLLALTGIVGCYSTLLTRRSYTHPYQICFFLLAVLCIDSKALVDVFSAFPQRLWTTRTRSTYEPIDDSAAPLTESDRSIDLLGGSIRTGKLPYSLSFRKIRMKLLGCTVACFWIVYGVLNFTERPEHRQPTLLDQNYVPLIPVEIVLSMYREPVDEVRKLISNLKSIPALSDARFAIYSKDSKADYGKIKEGTGADRVTALPNIGRGTKT